MSRLQVKPSGGTGKVHAITPDTAGWGYVGFGLYHLKPGQTAAEHTGDREVILVLVEGKAVLTADGQDFGEMGARMSVFEKTAPHCLVCPGRHGLAGRGHYRLRPGCLHGPGQGRVSGSSGLAPRGSN